MEKCYLDEENCSHSFFLRFERFIANKESSFPKRNSPLRKRYHLERASKSCLLNSQCCFVEFGFVIEGVLCFDERLDLVSLFLTFFILVIHHIFLVSFLCNSAQLYHLIQDTFHFLFNGRGNVSSVLNPKYFARSLEAPTSETSKK